MRVIRGLFIVILIACVAGWSVVATMLRLRRHRFGAKWWVAAGLLTVLGAIGGMWTTMYLEYEVCTRARAVGWPVPVVVFVLEGDQWTDFVPPTIVQYGAVAADTMVGIALALMPVTIWSWILTRRPGR